METVGESNDELVGDLLRWTSTHGQTSAGRQAKTYKYHLSVDTGCSLKDPPGVTNDWDGSRERDRELICMVMLSLHQGFLPLIGDSHTNSSQLFI